jgi:maltose O-acetyltransferase
VRFTREARALLRRTLRDIRAERSPEWYRARGAQIGKGVYIGRGSSLDTGFLQLIEIGDYATLSSRVEVLAHDASMRQGLGYTRIAKTVIGTRAYIGAGSVILPGVKIGDRAVIGAGSVVTRDVPPDVVAAGNPARVLRTTEELIAKHRALLADRPVYESRGWTTWDGGITPERQRQMRDALAEDSGYIR